jgi:hypothetical protein
MKQDFNHKERKEHRDKNLWRFFFAIFVFFAVNSFLDAACRAGILAPLCGNSIQMPFHQPFASKIKCLPTMITKFGWITFCFCPLANGNGGFIAHDSDARMSIPGNGTVYVSSQ